jgi:hypothetical protein
MKGPRLDAARRASNPGERRQQPPWSCRALTARGVKTARGGDWSDGSGCKRRHPGDDGRSRPGMRFLFLRRPRNIVLVATVDAA